MTKNCPNCGKELPDGAKFCMDCGYSIEVEENSGGFNFPLPTLFIIIIVAVLVIGGVFILTSSSGENSSPAEVVDNAFCLISDFYVPSSTEGTINYGRTSVLSINTVQFDSVGSIEVIKC